MPVHERVVAFGVRSGDTDVFIHIESNNILERNAAGLVSVNELFVDTDGRRTSGKT